MKTKLLTAARADDIPEASAGLWHIKKLTLAKGITAPKDGRLVHVPAGNYTQLWRWTNATIQERLDTGGGEPA